MLIISFLFLFGWLLFSFLYTSALRSFRKERISESHSLQPFLSIFRSRSRESQYDICVGFSNETKHFFFFIIRKAQSHTLTSMMGTTSALRRSNEQQFSFYWSLYTLLSYSYQQQDSLKRMKWTEKKEVDHLESAPRNSLSLLFYTNTGLSILEE